MGSAMSEEQSGYDFKDDLLNRLRDDFYRHCSEGTPERSVLYRHLERSAKSQDDAKMDAKTIIRRCRHYLDNHGHPATESQSRRITKSRAQAKDLDLAALYCSTQGMRLAHTETVIDDHASSSTPPPPATQHATPRANALGVGDDDIIAFYTLARRNEDCSRLMIPLRADPLTGTMLWLLGREWLADILYDDQAENDETQCLFTVLTPADYSAALADEFHPAHIPMAVSVAVTDPYAEGRYSTHLRMTFTDWNEAKERFAVIRGVALAEVVRPANSIAPDGCPEAFAPFFLPTDPQADSVVLSPAQTRRFEAMLADIRHPLSFMPPRSHHPGRFS